MCNRCFDEKDLPQKIKEAYSFDFQQIKKEMLKS